MNKKLQTSIGLEIPKKVFQFAYNYFFVDTCKYMESACRNMF